MKMLQGFMARVFPGNGYLHEIRSEMMYKGAKSQSVLPGWGHVSNFNAIRSCRDLSAPMQIYDTQVKFYSSLNIMLALDNSILKYII